MTALPSADERPADVIVGETIHLLARRQRITQAQLAAQLGLSASGLANKMHGRRPWMLPELQRAATLLDTDVAALVSLLPRLDSNQQPSG